MMTTVDDDLVRHQTTTWRDAISAVAHAARAIALAEDELAREETIVEGARIVIDQYERAEARDDQPRMAVVWPYLEKARTIVGAYEARCVAVAIERARVAVKRAKCVLAPRAATRVQSRGRDAGCLRRTRSRTSRRPRCAASGARARDGDDGDGGPGRRRAPAAIGGAS